MNRYITAKSITQNLYFWVMIWMLYVISYIVSMKYGYYPRQWDKVVYFTQMIVDCFIGLFGFLTWNSKTEQIDKKFYLLIAISLIPGLFTNEMYNVIINILDVNVITNNINKFWAIAYTIFLLIQIFAWSYLLISHQTIKNEPKPWFIKFSYIQSTIIVVISLASIKIFRSTIIIDLGVPGITNSTLEICLFILISISLARTKNKSLIHLEMGFLLLIAFNLAHRFSYATNHYFKTFDVVWIVCLLIISYGLISSWKNKAEKIEFFEYNSINMFAGAVFTVFSTLILALFALVDFFASSIEMNNVGTSNLLPQNIPSILIFSYSLSLFASKLVANYLSRPLEEISSRVDVIYENKSNVDKMLERRFEIAEIDKMDKFILKNMRQLQIANRVKSEFLMNMSHDFRTPASGIYHMAKLVYKRLDDAQLKNFQKLVVESSEKLMNLLEDILDYSRLDSVGFKLDIKEFDMKLLVNEIIIFVSAKANEKMLDIVTQYPAEMVNYIGDKHLVHRILLNIISNAIKFTHTGNITIAFDKEYIEDKLWLLIKVQDTGIGIDEQYYQYIFEPFNKVETAETSKNSGIGLGLSNVCLMLKKIDGKISLDSTLGKGSIFTLHLPIVES